MNEQRRAASHETLEIQMVVVKCATPLNSPE